MEDDPRRATDRHDVVVVVPSEEQVVRVDVAPGDTVVLPFSDNDDIMMKQGNGNLGIKADDTTVILLGFIAANEPHHPVIVESAEGTPLDVSALLAAYESYIEVECACGPPIGMGFPNSGAIFQPFEGGVTLRPIEAVGPIGAEAPALQV